MYFSASGSTGTAEQLLETEDWLDYFSSELIVIHIPTKDKNIVTVPDADNSTYIQSVTFWQGKLIYKGFDFADEMQMSGKTDVYMSELDGSNPKTIIEDVRQGIRILTDDDYMYLTNTAFVLRGEEETQVYQVYNKELQLVDTMGVPYAMPRDGEIGNSKGTYFFKQMEDESIVLVYFDKNTIGSYQGNVFVYNEVAKWEYANADLDD